MTRIGLFSATPSGFAGRLATLSLERALTIAAIEPGEGDHAPDTRVLPVAWDEAHEVGAGWKRVGEKAGSCVALLVDDPAWAAPLRAHLFQADPRTHGLTWWRPPGRGARD